MVPSVVPASSQWQKRYEPGVQISPPASASAASAPASESPPEDPELEPELPPDPESPLVLEPELLPAGALAHLARGSAPWTCDWVHPWVEGASPASQWSELSGAHAAAMAFWSSPVSPPLLPLQAMPTKEDAISERIVR
jgi:hypothetical protein